MYYENAKTFSAVYIYVVYRKIMTKRSEYTCCKLPTHNFVDSLRINVSILLLIFFVSPCLNNLVASSKTIITPTFYGNNNLYKLLYFILFEMYLLYILLFVICKYLYVYVQMYRHIQIHNI